jgi:hypothetical protein
VLLELQVQEREQPEFVLVEGWVQGQERETGVERAERCSAPKETNDNDRQCREGLLVFGIGSYYFEMEGYSFAELDGTDVKGRVVNLALVCRIVGIDLDLAEENVLLPVIQKKFLHKVLQVTPSNPGQLDTNVVLRVFLENLGVFGKQAGFSSWEKFPHDVINLVLEKSKIIAHPLLFLYFFIKGLVDRFLLTKNCIVTFDQLRHQLPIPVGIHSGTAKLD